MKKICIIFFITILFSLFFFSNDAQAWVYGGITLSAPINGATTTLFPTFKYTASYYSVPVYDPVSERICLKPPGGTQTCYSTSDTSYGRVFNCSAGTCTATSFLSLTADTTYTWFMSACGSSNCISSSQATFKTRALPNTPNLISPENNAVNVPAFSTQVTGSDENGSYTYTSTGVNLSWEDVGANYYMIYADQFITGIGRKFFRVGSTAGTTTLAFTAIYNTFYNWYVYACNENVGDYYAYGISYPYPSPQGECVKSETWSFTTEVAPAPQGITLVGPTQNINYCENFIFSWGCSQYCYAYTGYSAQIEGIDEGMPFNLSCSGTASCALTLFSQMNFRWRVMACNGANCAYSGYGNFTTGSCATPIMTANTPANHEVIQTSAPTPVNISWNVSLDPFYGSPMMIYFGYYDTTWNLVSLGAGARNYTLNSVPYGTYRWFIASCRTSYGFACARSAIYDFTIAPPAVTLPTVTTETAIVDVQNNKVTFWGNVTNTGNENPDHRYIDWDTDASGEPYTNTVDLGSGGTGIYLTTINITTGTIYYYRAGAHNSAGDGKGSEKKAAIYTAAGNDGQFTTLNPPNNPPNKPVKSQETTWDHCIFLGKSIPTFYWTYSDFDGDEMKAYEIEVDDDSSFHAPKFNHLADLGATSTAYALNLSQDDDSDWIDELNWNATYFWRVRVKDSHNSWSLWSNSNQFKTPQEAYPYSGFTWEPQEPNQKEVVIFTPDDTGLLYLWTVTEGIAVFTDSTGPTSEQPHIRFESSVNKIKLQVTKNSYTCESEEYEITANLPLPEYKEVPPIIWFKNFLSQLASIAKSLF